jgi:hypothetical protein
VTIGGVYLGEYAPTIAATIPPPAIHACGWSRTKAAAAVAGVLAALDGIAVFATPPETFNPPAYIVGYPSSVAYGHVGFGMDLASLPVMAAAGPNSADDVDALIQNAKDAIDADPTLGGAVGNATVATQANWRRVDVAGAQVLAADLVLEIRM